MLHSSVARRALDPDPTRLLGVVPDLGPVVAVTENFGARLRCDGTYGAPDIGRHTGIVIGDNIDLRVFPSGFTSAYATPNDAEPQALVVLDASGVRSHLIELGPDSNRLAYASAVASLATGDDAPATDDDAFATLASASSSPALDDASVDVAAYRQAYAAMTDTHDFFFLLRRFKLEREQGLRLAGFDYARPLGPSAYVALFEDALEHRIPLMLFVASDGMVQIASGPIDEIFRDTAEQFCVRSSRASLALAPDVLARAWAVTKPTSLGNVTSLELYGPHGELALQVFGERHEGNAERTDWHEAVDALG